MFPELPIDKELPLVTILARVHIFLRRHSQQEREREKRETQAKTDIKKRTFMMKGKIDISEVVGEEKRTSNHREDRRNFCQIARFFASLLFSANRTIKIEGLYPPSIFFLLDYKFNCTVRFCVL